MSSSSANSRKLAFTFHDKVWGSRDITPWFATRDGLTGEVWIESVANILIKFLFTEQNLSVQVHPGGPAPVGKTEMWHILRASPGASIALGFREQVSPEEVRAACLSGEVEKMLRWIEVKPGETYFVPAGTVHALGAGLAVCEIQQDSDITYRLYDYGRPRELHLETGLAASYFGPHPGATGFPVECEYFRTERIVVPAGETRVLEGRPQSQVVFVQGAGSAGGAEYRLGEGWQVDQALTVSAREDTVILRASPPA